MSSMSSSISESNSSYDFILVQTFLFKKSFIFTDASIILDSLNDSKSRQREVKPCFYPACTIY